MVKTVTETHLDASPDKVALYLEAKARRDAAAKANIFRYYHDPVAFAHDCFHWEDGERLTEYQEEVLSSIPAKKKVVVRSLHGAGKTTTDALAILWFAITRDAAAVDWKCATTAGAWRQLEQYLWPEVRKWARKLRWERLGRPPFNRGELLRLNLNLQYGSAFAVASDVPALIEGVHADAVLYVFDESKAINPGTFDAAEGAFSGGGEAFALASSTPGEPIGRFWELCSHRPGFEDWHSIHISLERATIAGRADPDWVAQRERQWGKSSALYANRVLGEFHSSEEDGVIPLSWVEAAIERWKDTTEALKAGTAHLPLLSAVGVDVARSGEDKTVLALRYGDRIDELRYSFHEMTNETAGRVGGVLTAHPSAVGIVDTDGLGAGVTDSVRENGHTVVAFHAGAGVDKLTRDESGELGFLNVRAAAWWRLRQLLDPKNDSTVELPDDDTLTGDLTAPHWKVTSKSLIQIESKDDIKKRLRRSTDAADAVVQAFWEARTRKRRHMTFAGRETDPGAQQ